MRTGQKVLHPGTMKWLILAILLFLLGGDGSFQNVEAGKVLGFFHFPGRSHYVMFEALMKELAARGHQVTLVTHFPQKSPIENVTEINLAGSVHFATGGFKLESMAEFGVVGILRYIWQDMANYCKHALEHPRVEELIKSEEQFDLVVFEIFGTDCCYGFPWRFKAPSIGMTSLPRMPLAQHRVGNPENPAYLPMTFLKYSTKMSFWQRLSNSFWVVAVWIGEMLFVYPFVEDLNNKVFGPEIPPLDDLMYNTSLILLNSHFSLNGALPAVPAVVEVGGMHVSPIPGELPELLREWLDGADESGVVYVSFGSLAHAEDMPLAPLKAMAEVLNSLKERVVWRCDGKVVGQRLGFELGPNIFTATWTPQADIIAHPKVKVFVSHGGLMGTQESVYWGKPMVVVPFFSDQPQNTMNLLVRGMALEVPFHDITESSFGKALKSVLNDPSYAENARRVSELFRDRPRPPLQEAVFWTEYVMRHRGAPHMQSAAVHLRWWQLLLLDVLGAAFAAVAAAVAFCLLLFRCLCRRSPSDKVKRS